MANAFNNSLTANNEILNFYAESAFIALLMYIT